MTPTPGLGLCPLGSRPLGSALPSLGRSLKRSCYVTSMGMFLLENVLYDQRDPRSI